MWDDIIIGKGSKITSAYHIFKIVGDHHISQNSTSYWIIHKWIDIIEVGITIFKNTKEGKELKALIDKETSLKNINVWLDKLIIKKLPYNKLMNLIQRIKEESFKKGQKNRSQEIANLLGLGR